MQDMDSVYEYLELMADTVSGTKLTAMGKLGRFPQCERNGVDQVCGGQGAWMHLFLLPET